MSDTLAEIRRAAFDLRQSDPHEAVRVLRRAAAEGGEAEVLARGALGEIYLEEFGDLDGALHEFRRVLQLAPGLPAAELGLARTLRASGDFNAASDGFERALGGLERDLRSFRDGEIPPGAEEIALTALEVAVELAELRGAAAGGAGFARDGRSANAQSMGGGNVHVAFDEDLLRWAQSVRLFDEEEADEGGDGFAGDGRSAEARSIGGDDWIRFHSLWAQLRLLTGRGEEALIELRGAKMLPEGERDRLLALVRAEMGLSDVVQLGRKE